MTDEAKVELAKLKAKLAASQRLGTGMKDRIAEIERRIAEIEASG